MADIPFLPTALDPAEVLLTPLLQQLATMGQTQQGQITQGLAGIKAANSNAPAFDPEAGPFSLFQEPSTAAALSSIFLGSQFPGGTPTPGGISPEALEFLSSDAGKGRSRIGAIGTDIAAGVGEAGALVNRLLQAPFDITTALFKPAEKPFLEGTPTGRALGVEPAGPAVGPAPGQRTTEQLLGDFFAPRGRGGAGLKLPSLQALPAVPQRGAIEPTDFTKFEEALSALAPSPLGKGEEKGILQTARFAGLAEALQGLPEFASVGDILLAAGTGLLAGKTRGQAEIRAEEKVYEAQLFEFNRLRADGELARAEVVRNEAEATAERVFRNKTLEFEREMLELQRRQPKLLGISAAALGGGTIWQIIGEDGQIEIKRESPSAILSAYSTSSALLGQSGAGPKGQALAIPTIPGSILNAPMQMLRALNVSQLEPIFGEELLNESLDFGLEASRNMIATGNNDAAGRIATDAQFGLLSQAMFADERLMRSVLEAIGSPIRGNTQ